MPTSSNQATGEPPESADDLNIESRLALIHRVLVPDEDYPKEYAILISDRRSIFIRQPKTRSAFWLRGEMRWGTALVTDVVPKTLEDYQESSLDSLSAEPSNFSVSHGSVSSLVMKADEPTFRAREFFVRWTMQRQKEVYQVYHFEMTCGGAPDGPGKVQFYAVPLGAYFKPRRMHQTRENILREYAEGILELYRRACLPNPHAHGSPKSQVLSGAAFFK